MSNLIIGCVDVYYYDKYAKASCIIFEEGDNKSRIISTYSEMNYDIAEYIPGQFYKRELPCILKVLEKVKERIDIIVIDGFVWVGKNKMGLGAHVFEALNGTTPVIGVAKTYFKGCTGFLEIYRCNSSKPLYVSSIGIDLNYSAQLITNMEGKYRIPDILKKVDALSREKI